jgi:hypothetical protein
MTKERSFGPSVLEKIWWCKTLKSWKALFSSTSPEKMYYEVTYNGDKAYIDVYKKCYNVCIKDKKSSSPFKMERIEKAIHKILQRQSENPEYVPVPSSLNTKNRTEGTNGEGEESGASST